MMALIEKAETFYLRYAFESTLCLYVRDAFLGHFAGTSVQKDDVVLHNVGNSCASIRPGNIVPLDKLFEL